MVDPGAIVAVPLRLRLVSVNLDRQAVDVQRDACAPLPAVLGTQVTTGEFKRGFTQDLEICGFGQHRRASRQRGLGGQTGVSCQRRQPGRGADRQTHRRIMAQRICIVMILPALCRQQHHGSQQGRKVMDDIGLAAVVIHLRCHPRDDLGRIKHFAKEHGTGIPG